MDDFTAAQLERVRSDDRLRARAREAAAMTREERLHTAYHLGRLAGQMLARQPPERVAAVEASRPGLDAAARAALRRLAEAT